MAQTLKVLGQIRPSGGVLTAAYTVPGTVLGTVVSSLVVTNTTGFSETFRISVAVAGAVDAIQQYLYYDVNVNANDTYIATIGQTLGPNDVVRCQSGNGRVNFNLSGVETS